MSRGDRMAYDVPHGDISALQKFDGILTATAWGRVSAVINDVGTLREVITWPCGNLRNAGALSADHACDFEI